MNFRIALPQPALPARGNIKGVALENLVRSYQGEYGCERLAEVLRTLPPWYRLFLGEDFEPEPNRWYPTQLWQAVHEALLRGLSDGERAAFLETFAHEVVRQALRGPRRLFFALFMTPQRMAAHGPKAWRAFHDSGECLFAVEAPARHIVRLTDWSGHDRFTCQAQVPLLRHTYEVLGCREVVTERLRCIDAGASECAFVVRWNQ